MGVSRPNAHTKTIQKSRAYGQTTGRGFVHGTGAHRAVVRTRQRARSGEARTSELTYAHSSAVDGDDVPAGSGRVVPGSDSLGATTPPVVPRTRRCSRSMRSRSSTR